MHASLCFLTRQPGRPFSSTGPGIERLYPTCYGTSSLLSRREPQCETQAIFSGAAGMWAKLTQAQAAAFVQRVRPMLRFLHACRKRLDTRGFDPKSTFYAAVAKAYDAVHALHVELHYMSVQRGVGKPHEQAAEEDKKER
jgi:hypothetical protein